MTIVQRYPVAAEQMAESCSAKPKTVAKKDDSPSDAAEAEKPANLWQTTLAKHGFASIGACNPERGTAFLDEMQTSRVSPKAPRAISVL